jgi:hypothetical protein
MSRFFVAKSWLGATGVALGLWGMAAEQRWLVWAAVACLGTAFVLRFTEPRGES